MYNISISVVLGSWFCDPLRERAALVCVLLAFAALLQIRCHDVAYKPAGGLL